MRRPTSNYIHCPYCNYAFGNGISVVFGDIVEQCTCAGMREAIKSKKMQAEIDELKAQLKRK